MLFETHPGGGAYTCLSIVGPDGSKLVDFCDDGSIYFLKIHRDGSYVQNDDFVRPINYLERLERREGAPQLVREACVALGLQTHLKRPPSTADVLMVRYITAFLSHATFGVHQWLCLQGMHNSTGPSGCYIRTTLFDAFPQVQGISSSSYAGKWPQFEQSCHFWFLCRDEEPRLCLSTDGRLWDTSGKTWDLMQEYESLGRNLWRLVVATGAEEMK
jgi:hypothetical protein